jgi:hypothetical protein
MGELLPFAQRQFPALTDLGLRMPDAPRCSAELRATREWITFFKAIGSLGSMSSPRRVFPVDAEFYGLKTFRPEAGLYKSSKRLFRIRAALHRLIYGLFASPWQHASNEPLVLDGAVCGFGRKLHAIRG